MAVGPGGVALRLAIAGAAMSFGVGAIAPFVVLRATRAGSDAAAGMMFLCEALAVLLAVGAGGFAVGALIRRRKHARDTAWAAVIVLVVAIIEAVLAPIVWLGWAIASTPFR